MVRLKMPVALALVIMIVSLLFNLSCQSSQTDQTEVQEIINADSTRFDNQVDDLVSLMATIQEPCDLDVKKIFPDGWIAETYLAKGVIDMVAVAVPIPKDIIRGMTIQQMTKTIVYLVRGGVLDPNTNFYITSTWNGAPYDWGLIEGPNLEQRSYPKAVSKEYFNSYKIMFQPYMVPPEASHGIYEYPFDVKNCSLAGAARMAQDLKAASPYKAINAGTYTDNTSYLAAIRDLEKAIKKVEEDNTAYMNFLILINRTFLVKTTNPDTKTDGVSTYLVKLTDNKSKLIEIKKAVADFKTWDFSAVINLNQKKK